MAPPIATGSGSPGPGIRAAASPQSSSSGQTRDNGASGVHVDDDDTEDLVAIWGGDASGVNAAADGDDDELLDDDPLSHDPGEPMSFKRKQKQQGGILPTRLFRGFGATTAAAGGHRSDSPQTGGGGGGGSSASPSSSPRRRDTHNNGQQAGVTAAANGGVSGAGYNGAFQDKDGAVGGAHPLDWYVEGPGRRVGYEDLTAIDWIFEYTKERQRQRVLASSTSGLAGYAQRLLDASQVWVVLVLTGLAVGALAAGIDVATDWLADLKGGYCDPKTEGGAFYLSKTFCCMGYSDSATCVGWRPWAAALGITSAGGKWFIEYFFFLLFSVTLAVCAGVLVKEYAIYAKHSGIPEIKTVLGGFIIRRFLGTWTLITKSLGLCLAVASGMWLGKEGPLVHVACCCANLFIMAFTNINNNEARKREVLSAAAASGISVAFGSPVGGVLFSLEQLSYYFPDKTMWQSFVCAMTAAVMLQALDPFRTGQLVLYQVKYTSGWHAFELVPFAILGVIGGTYGGLFIKANMLVARWKKTYAAYLPGPLQQVAIVALLTALVNYPNLYMRAQSTELVSNLFSECSQVTEDQFGLCKTGAATAGTIVLLLFASVLGFFLAAITFGLQIPAGIILPSMAIGALSGRALGIVMDIWVRNFPDFRPFQSCEPEMPCITPGTYAIIGAAATLAGVTRMTVSIVVIMFELTGALTYVLPIMVAVMISKWVGDAFSRRGIYESWIHVNEYPFLDNSEEATSAGDRVPDVPASQIMTRIEDLVVLTATGHTMATLQHILDAHPYRGFPVVSDPRDAVLLGYISRAELAYNLATATQPPRLLPPATTEVFFSHQVLADPRTTLDLRPWMDQTPITLPSRARLHLAVAYFQKLGLRYVLFVDRGVLQGLLTKKDVWYVLNGAEETRRTGGGNGVGGVASGITREDGGGEQRGLLRGVAGDGEEDDEDEEDDGHGVGRAGVGGVSPGIERSSIL